MKESGQAAQLQGRSTYEDPSTGYSVFTESFLRDRQGHCCGNRRDTLRLDIKYTVISLYTALIKCTLYMHVPVIRAIFNYEIVPPSPFGVQVADGMMLAYRVSALPVQKMVDQVAASSL